MAVVEYSDDDDFAERIGELILGGIPIRMALRGKYRDLLASHIVAGTLVDPARIGTIPSLQTFLAAVMLAAGAEQPVSYSTEGNTIVVSIGDRGNPTQDDPGK